MTHQKRNAPSTREAVSQQRGGRVLEDNRATFKQLQLKQKMADEPLQRVKEEDELLQEKSAQPNRTGLPDNLKSGIESLSGLSMDPVKVHYNSSQPAQLNALAYAQGTDIHVAPGQEKHLPHEAWHLVQQGQGRVQPTMQMKDGVPVNDDLGLEREADEMGGKAAAMQRVSKSIDSEPIDSIPIRQRKSTTAVQIMERNLTSTEQGHKQLLAFHPVSQPYIQKKSDLHKPAGQLSADNKVMQLYTNVSQGYIWGYGKGTGPNTPNFDFQEIEASKTINAAASTIDYGVNANQVFEDSPVLRVSDDRLMAVPTREKSDSKSFFATQAKIDESNTLLHNAGAPLRLTAGAGQIRLSDGINPFGPTLNQVIPNLANVVNNSSECGAFAANILGTPMQNAETVNAGVMAQIPGLGGFSQTRGRDVTINAALGGQNPNTLGANENADPEVGEAFGIYARTQLPAVGIATTLWNGIVSVKDYLTKTKPHLKWGEHWAGVVAKSGGDYVTLENYNRVAGDTDLVEEAVENDFKELKAAGGGIHAYVGNTQNYANLGGESRLNRLVRLGLNYIKYAVQIGAVAGYYSSQYDRWYFQMYGTGGKSFHEQFKYSAPNGVTFKTRGTDNQLKTLLAPKLTALLPPDNYQAGAAATLVAQAFLLNAAVGRANIIAAFAVAEKSICLTRLNSAYAFEQTQVHNMMNLANAHAQAVINVNTAVGDNVNAECIAGITAMQNS